MRFSLLLLTLWPAIACAAERTVKFSAPMYFLSPMKAIVLTRAGEPGPGEAKHKAVATVAALNEEMKLDGDGPFDVWFVPTDGKPIKAVAGLKPGAGQTAVKLNDHLGVIRFKGDGQPRGKLIVTAYDDPGPEEKKHVVVQTAADVRAEMVVGPGDYAVWVVPDSGARPRRVVDKVRVLAGKTAEAE